MWKGLTLEGEIVRNPNVSLSPILSRNEKVEHHIRKKIYKSITLIFSWRLSPMGMIFIPCYKGYSHKPEEFASIQDMSNGVKVLALTLAKLSSQLHLQK